MNIHWDDIRFLLHVSRFSKLAKAAQHMGQDTSTVSRRLKRLESDNAPSAALDTLPLFAVAEPEPEPLVSVVEDRLGAVDADGLSPREALDLVYELKALTKKT